MEVDLTLTEREAELMEPIIQRAINQIINEPTAHLLTDEYFIILNKLKVARLHPKRATELTEEIAAAKDRKRRKALYGKDWKMFK